MARRKADPEPEDDQPREPGETLPPIEDMVRKLSGRFASEIVIDDEEIDEADPA